MYSNENLHIYYTRMCAYTLNLYANIIYVLMSILNVCSHMLYSHTHLYIERDRESIIVKVWSCYNCINVYDAQLYES